MRVLLFSVMAYDQISGSPIRCRTIADGLRTCNVNIAICSTRIKSDFVVDYPFFDFNKFICIEECLHVAIESFRPDVILVITIGLLDVVAFAAQKHNIPFVVDVHGIRSIELFSEKMQIAEKLRIWRDACNWERAIFKANHVIAANPMLGMWLGRILHKVDVIAGIVTENFFSVSPAKCDDSCVHFVYSGNFSKYQGVDILLKAITLLSQDFFKHVSFTLQGTVSGKAEDHYYYRRAKDMGRIIDVAPVSHVEFPEFLSQYHVSLIPRPWALATYLAFPQKLVEGLASGRYVVASDMAPHRYAIRHGKNGFLYKNGVTGLLQMLYQVPQLIQKSFVAATAQQQAMRYRQSCQCQKISNILENCL